MSNSQGPIPNIFTPAAATDHLATEAEKIQAGVALAKVRTLAREFLTPFSSSPALDADLILARVCKLSRLELMTEGARIFSVDEREKALTLLSRRVAGEPIAYILGEKEFYGLHFKVNPDVLIPRPDTELLVEEAIKVLKTQEIPLKVIDVCTGSGCIAIAIAHNVKSACVQAIDLSELALAVAKDNARALGVSDQIDFLLGDLLDPVTQAREVDLIVSNPPYIRPDEMADLMRDVRDFEPHLALVGQNADGLGLHRKIIEQAAPILKAGGTLMMEIGQGQAEILEGLHFEGFSAANFLKDYAGIWRVVTYNRLPSAQKNR